MLAFARALISSFKALVALSVPSKTSASVPLHAHAPYTNPSRSTGEMMVFIMYLLAYDTSQRLPVEFQTADAKSTCGCVSNAAKYSQMEIEKLHSLRIRLTA